MDHPFWVAIKKPAGERTEAEKALAAAVLLMSTRGDIFLNVDGEDIPCSAMTMEGIFDALVKQHDALLLPHL